MQKKLKLNNLLQRQQNVKTHQMAFKGAAVNELFGLRAKNLDCHTFRPKARFFFKNGILKKDFFQSKL